METTDEVDSGEDAPAGLPEPIDWDTFWDKPRDPAAKARYEAEKADTSLFDAACTGHDLRGIECASRTCTNRHVEDPAKVAARDGIAIEHLAEQVGRWAGYRSPASADPSVGAVAAIEKMLDLFGVNLDLAKAAGVDVASFEAEPVTLPDGTIDRGGWVDHHQIAELHLDAIRAAGFVVIPTEYFKANQ